MFVKQLSVFIENHEGRLEQVTEVLRGESINILSLSMANTIEYDMLRMIASDPKKAKNGLREKGFSAIPTDILVVRLEGHADGPHKMTHTLCGQELNIEYMYVLASANRRAMIVEASDGKIATKAITDGGLVLYSSEETCW